MDIKTKFTAIMDFIPFAIGMTSLIVLRHTLPSAYQYVETNHADKLVKKGKELEETFKCVITPQQFLNHSTKNLNIVKSIWKSTCLTIFCPATVGKNIAYENLPLHHRVTFQQSQLSDLTKSKYKYYILNFGSSS